MDLDPGDSFPETIKRGRDHFFNAKRQVGAAVRVAACIDLNEHVEFS